MQKTPEQAYKPLPISKKAIKPISKALDYLIQGCLTHGYTIQVGNGLYKDFGPIVKAIDDALTTQLGLRLPPVRPTQSIATIWIDRTKEGKDQISDWTCLPHVEVLIRNAFQRAEKLTGSCEPLVPTKPVEKPIMATSKELELNDIMENPWIELATKALTTKELTMEELDDVVERLWIEQHKVPTRVVELVKALREAHDVIVDKAPDAEELLDITRTLNEWKDVE